MKNGIGKENIKKSKIIVRKKGQLIAITVLGTIFLVAGLLLLFLWYRPFIHWEKIEVGNNCVMTLLKEYKGGNADIMYRFEYNGDTYVKIFNNAVFHNRGMVGLDKTRINTIYINPENPLDAKLGMQGQVASLWFCIFLIVFGLFFIVFNIIDCLSRETKKVEHMEAKYEKK